MARAKRRVQITLDMTPMVDIGFLLVIFFMSTYHARPPETVRVNLPLSRSPLKVPEQQVLIISVLRPQDALALADSFAPVKLMNRYQKYLTQDTVFTRGRPSLAIDRAVRDMREGDLRDSVRAELRYLTHERKMARAESLLLWWNTGRDAAQPMLFSDIGPVIRRIRIEDPNTVLVIKTDSMSRSGDVLRLMEQLQDPNVNMLRFSLMTMMRESRPGRGGLRREG